MLLVVVVVVALGLMALAALVVQLRKWEMIDPAYVRLMAGAGAVSVVLLAVMLVAISVGVSILLVLMSLGVLAVAGLFASYAYRDQSGTRWRQEAPEETRKVLQTILVVLALFFLFCAIAILVGAFSTPLPAAITCALVLGVLATVIRRRPAWKEEFFRDYRNVGVWPKVAIVAAWLFVMASASIRSIDQSELAAGQWLEPAVLGTLTLSLPLLWLLLELGMLRERKPAAQPDVASPQT